MTYGDAEVPAAAAAANGGAGEAEEKKKRRRKRRGRRKNRKGTDEEIIASRYVRQWAAAIGGDDDGDGERRVVFEMHAHSACSDGFLSPTALVERAHKKGSKQKVKLLKFYPESLKTSAGRALVKVLALTDHDTLTGIAEAMEAACKFGMRIIPGVEISAVYRDDAERKEPVHILAYYGSWGPARSEELENLLSNIRDGRYLRAEEMLLKLSKLNMPLKWEHIAKIAGNGVAPGRVHIARAMVESGYVENLKQAFSKYLYDDGPAYARGNEPFAEDVVQLIVQTGGVATLAHPWALKNPIAVIKSLKTAGLHAIEVYRSDGKLSGLSDLADTYGLLKLGGSDYHGRTGQEEPDLGSVNLPVVAIYEFLKFARPLWCEAIYNILSTCAEEPSDINLERLVRFGRSNSLMENLTTDDAPDVLDLWLSSWLDKEEWDATEFETIRIKMTDIILGEREC